MIRKYKQLLLIIILIMSLLSACSYSNLKPTVIDKAINDENSLVLKIEELRVKKVESNLDPYLGSEYFLTCDDVVAIFKHYIVILSISKNKVVDAKIVNLEKMVSIQAESININNRKINITGTVEMGRLWKTNVLIIINNDLTTKMQVGKFIFSAEKSNGDYEIYEFDMEYKIMKRSIYNKIPIR